MVKNSQSLHPTHETSPLPLTLPVSNFLPIITLRASVSSAFLAHTARCSHLLPGSLVIPIQTPPVYSLLSTSPRLAHPHRAHPHYCSIRHFSFKSLHPLTRSFTLYLCSALRAPAPRSVSASLTGALPVTPRLTRWITFTSAQKISLRKFIFKPRR